MSLNKHRSVIVVSKLVRAGLRLRGGGSALPGLVAEKMAPSFLADSLSKLPEGVILVLGTNGKTTTTKMIADSLGALGKNVLTNDSGSNYTRGLASKVVEGISWKGELGHDIAVFELDEIYATHFIRLFKPDYVVALNVMRDQLDRFGEIDIAMGYIKKVMLAAKQKVVANGNDPLMLRASAKCQAVTYFGVSQKLSPQFPSDEQLLALDGYQVEDVVGPPLDVELSDFKDNRPVFKIDGQDYEDEFVVNGGYNYQNAAAAIALLRVVMPGVSTSDIVSAVAKVEPAFGRGENIKINDLDIEIMLVKNPGGFQQVLKQHSAATPVLIAINDNYADGRDVSWLYDVNFSSLKDSLSTQVTGIRAYDMALRLRYDELEVTSVETDISMALKSFLSSHKQQRHIIYATYTAMLDIRRILRSYVAIGGPL